MNTSIQDANNLGWKLRMVLQRLAPRAILKSYGSERRPIAQDLIAFDRGYLKLFSGSTDDFDSAFLRAMKFTTGLSIRYPPSALVQLPGNQTSHQAPSFLKADLVPGKRLPDFHVVNQADATRTSIHQRLEANGCFRIIVFAGDISQPSSFDRLQKLGTWLASSQGLGLLSNGINALVEALVVHCAPRAKIEFLDLHKVFRPWSETQGYDYWRVYVDEESAPEVLGKVYERLEIERERGCMAVVRPDGYVGCLTGLDQVEEIRRYFAGFVIRLL
jgi:phenol 2-monooxygenase (NADPH)